ncbi:hypothetical protein CspeluHIS016_0102560 [Cutaneotrichosporon spelunceum]|uniref:WW domain-containing protein n=1 Tax=Cutaneotrichosporon spelunceum TaxID=1672016 RepID=A0AAD3TN07_9TREE|nr:hypothetical protein CspeluHIS016_0102560 [Cutaneotrichosporon spelunceum]
MSSNPDTRPLPDGWVTQLNTQYNTWFYVNTRAPGGPQSQWTHPADDKPPAHDFASPSGPPPGQNEKASYSVEKNDYGQSSQQAPYDQQRQFGQPQQQYQQYQQPYQQQYQQQYQQAPPQQREKRSFLSKLTGKASGQQQGYPGGYGQPMGYGQQPMYGGYPQQGMMMPGGGRKPGMGAGGGMALGAGAGLLGGMMLGNAMSDHDDYAEGYADGASGGGFDGGDFDGGGFDF